MRDLSQRSIRGHLIAMAIPLTVGMLVQTLGVGTVSLIAQSLGAQDPGARAVGSGKRCCRDWRASSRRW